jgi:hypothetical protein
LTGDIHSLWAETTGAVWRQQGSLTVTEMLLVVIRLAVARLAQLLTAGAPL